jgi:pyranose oxidase
LSVPSIPGGNQQVIQPQQHHKSLDAQTARCVGGSSTLWSCATPEAHPNLERSDLFTNLEWVALYNEARALTGTSSTEFDMSIRHQLVKHVLQNAYSGTKRMFTSLPLAVARDKKIPDCITWSSSATVFGHITKTPTQDGSRLFTLMPDHACEVLERDSTNGNITGAAIQDLHHGCYLRIKAKKYVVCAGSIHTPQILYNSGYYETLPAVVSLRCSYVW